MPSIRLLVRHGEGPPEAYEADDDEIVIGRLANSASVVPGSNANYLALARDPSVSRVHARVFLDRGRWRIEDLKSRTGTFLNGRPVRRAAALADGDRLCLGDTTLDVQLPTGAPEEDRWILLHHLEVHETQPPPAFPEDRRLEILAAVSQLTAQTSSRPALFEGLMREISAAFPGAQRKTILTLEDCELVPQVFRPTDRSYVSFTLAQRALKSHQALLWMRKAEGGSPLSPSLADTVSALYAPMLFGGRAVGAIHLDSRAAAVAFDERDLKLLSVIANTAGPALMAADRSAVDEPPSVFVSYAREDRRFVNRLAADLRRRRIKVWFDERLRTGLSWREQIAVAIAKMNACVLVVSPPSMASEGVKHELATARSVSKEILPLMLDESTLPDELRELQYVAFGASYEAGMAELAGRIHELGRAATG
jgi:hypothetical protein